MAEPLVSDYSEKSVGRVGWMGWCMHRPSRPDVMSYGMKAFNGQITFDVGNTSVKTGVFIPGEYRVNPYSVKGGSIVTAHDGRGALFKNKDYVVSQYIDPGIHTVHDDNIAEWQNTYVVCWPFYNSYYRDYKGYISGAKYWHTMYLVGDWWRYRAASKADEVATPHEAADYEQLSLQKAYGKLRSADLDLGESLGEYKETIQMLRHPLSNLKKFLFDDRARNWRLLTALAREDKREVAYLLGRTGFATADTMASTWLELRYGFRPLVSLVQDVIDRVQQKKEEILDPTKIRSAKSRLMFGPYTTWADVDYSNSTYQKIRSRVLVEDTYWSTASVQYKQTETSGFLDSLGLTPRFLPEVAWQLATLSFVVDWVFTIGPWLATLRVNPGIEVLGNTTGFKHQRKIKVFKTEMRTVDSNTVGTNPGLPWKPLAGVHEPSGDLMSERTTYDRKIHTDLSYLPHFTWGRTLDLFKAIDSISLIWQFASKLWR